MGKTSKAQSLETDPKEDHPVIQQLRQAVDEIDPDKLRDSVAQILKRNPDLSSARIKYFLDGIVGSARSLVRDLEDFAGQFSADSFQIQTNESSTRETSLIRNKVVASIRSHFLGGETPERDSFTPFPNVDPVIGNDGSIWDLGVLREYPDYSGASAKPYPRSESIVLTRRIESPIQVLDL